jgi:hypothetical protein
MMNDASRMRHDAWEVDVLKMLQKMYRSKMSCNDPVNNTIAVRFLK